MSRTMFPACVLVKNVKRHKQAKFSGKVTGTGVVVVVSGRFYLFLTLPSPHGTTPRKCDRRWERTWRDGNRAVRDPAIPLGGPGWHGIARLPSLFLLYRSSPAGSLALPWSTDFVLGQCSTVPYLLDVKLSSGMKHRSTLGCKRPPHPQGKRLAITELVRDPVYAVWEPRDMPWVTARGG